ncbi:TPR-like protein [Thozetella sp. PMI_491]|nr:TPR-like protein [Thozetella sp. PMI_491]
MASEYYNLGFHTRPVGAKNDEAQTWFNRGLVWTFGFNHEEAVKCFEKAIAADAGCAMAYWGLAYALGPNYNKPWDFFDDHELETTVERAHKATSKAAEEAKSDVEKALARALLARYPLAGGDPSTSREKTSVWNKEYAEAMVVVHKQYPEDADVAAICADALMNLTPWQLWDIRSGKPAEGARTLEIIETLEGGLRRAPKHPGLLHLYIHAMEMSNHPEAALGVADTLRGLVPDSGHLNHMPTHIDILCGDYRRVMSSNLEAMVSDRKFLERDGAMNFYTLYRSHDFHFRIYGAMFAGCFQAAIDTIGELELSIPEALLRVESPPMADWLESFVAMRVHVLIRFGRWDDIINLELPEDQKLYCTTTALRHYAKGVAFAATGKVAEAEQQQVLFRKAVEKVPSTRTLFNNTCADILGVASAMLDGELEYRRGNFDAAFEHLRTAIQREDALPYDEPWGWMQPTRHAYGALLLEQGRVQEAADVYSADLGFDDTLPRALQHRNNVWSLHGFHECLQKLGRDGEARIVKQQLELATALADVKITSSCFCRRKCEST